jgi:N-acetylneuraminic acid mutarotase
MTVARYWATAVGLNGRLYVMGGYDGIDVVNTVEVYDPATNRWSTVTGMPIARWSAGAGAINGKIYAAGGFLRGTLPFNLAYTP